MTQQVNQFKKEMVVIPQCFDQLIQNVDALTTNSFQHQHYSKRDLHIVLRQISLSCTSTMPSFLSWTYQGILIVVSAGTVNCNHHQREAFENASSDPDPWRVRGLSDEVSAVGAVSCSLSGTWLLQREEIKAS